MNYSSLNRLQIMWIYRGTCSNIFFQMVFHMDYQLCPSYFNRNLSEHLAKIILEKKKVENISWIHIQDSMLFWVLLSYLRKYISEYLWEYCQLLQLFVAGFARGLDPVMPALMPSPKCHFLVEPHSDVSHVQGWAATEMLQERGRSSQGSRQVEGAVGDAGKDTGRVSPKS